MFSLFVFFQVIGLIISTKGSPIACQLKWASEGYGNIPWNSIESGSNEYVGRAYHIDKWIPGRVSTSSGKIFLTEGGSAFEYDTYEVLTNPDNCLLEWVKGYGGSTPPTDAISVDPLATNKDVYIARGVIAGLTLGGKFVLDESAIFISYDEQEEMRRYYQLLRSYYPPLKTVISKFRFQLTNFPNRSEILGQEAVRNNIPTDVVQYIEHSKMIQERFTLTEDTINWDGLSSITFSFPLWYGTSDVIGKFELDSDFPEETELTVYRERELRLRKDVTVRGTNTNPGNHHQVCSIVAIVEDLVSGIPFTAEAIYEAENMSRAQVEHIAKQLNRNILAEIPSRRNAVKGTITGKLNGRFAVHQSSQTNPMDARGVCAGYFTLTSR